MTHNAQQKMYQLYVLSTLKLKESVSFTRLGWMWWFLEPLLLIGLYYYLVKIIFQDNGEHLEYHLAIGIVCWRWWQTSLALATKSLVKYRKIVGTINFDIILIPIADVLGQTFLFFVALFILMGIGYFIYGFIPVSIAGLASLIAINVIFLSGLASCLAVANVFFRDIGQAINFILRILFYLTPILYSIDKVPDDYKIYIDLNPFSGFVENYRLILANEGTFLINSLQTPFLSGTLLLLLSIYITVKFRKSIIRYV